MNAVSYAPERSATILRDIFDVEVNIGEVVGRSLSARPVAIISNTSAFCHAFPFSEKVRGANL